MPLSLKSVIDDIFRDSITTLLSFPSHVKQNIEDLRDRLVERLKAIVDGITTLPERITECIKNIFIPSEGFIEGKIDYFRKKLLGMGIDTYNMGSIFNKEQPFEDLTCTIWGHEVTVVNMSIVDKVVLKFRPVIRGLLWLLLVLYNYDQFMGFIGQKGLTVGGIIKTVSGKENES